MEEYDVIIIGAGASGMAAAISVGAKAPEAEVLLLEKMNAPGKKIRASGNGRCNLSNSAAEKEFSTSAFFASLGVCIRTEREGRMYPYSEDAGDVEEALEERVRELGVRIRCRTPVKEIWREKGKSGFLVVTEEEQKPKSYFSRFLVLAAGGKAGPAFGTSGDGTSLCRKLGLPVTRLAPALTPVEVREETEDLAGVRQKCRATLYKGEKAIAQERGELQFTRYGLSGIMIFNLSRMMVVPEGKNLSNGFSDYRLELDFYPEGRRGEKKDQHRDWPVTRLLRTIVKRPLAERIARESGEDPEAAVWLLHHMVFHPSGLRGWKEAQVTRGGVPLKEIDPETMESFRIPGFYLAGEVLDYDGPCGGFNLHHAWETGIRAGTGISCRIRKKDRI